MNHHKSLPKLFGVFLALTIVFTAVGTVQATEIYPNGIIPVGVTVDDDVILNGNAVVMDGVVNGLLLASGNTVTINGTVNGDVIALGSQVTIGTKAVITGNLFAGAQSVTLDGQVEAVWQPVQLPSP
jgi:UDP-3-O-[3-hydroxymyristoyl] glucosamine N-acyltransferase